MPLNVAVESAQLVQTIVVLVQFVLQIVMDVVVHVVMIVVVVLAAVQETAMVAVVNVAEIVLVHASGPVQMIVRAPAQVTVKVAAQLDALHAMVALIVVVAMVPAQSDVTHHVIHQPMLNFNIFSFSERSFNG
mgnify:CR=1 FL=1